MSQHHSLLFVIADGGHARFVTPAADNALHTREAVDSSAATSQTGDMVSDRPGRSFESASPTRHALTPRTDPHTQAKLKFADLVAEKVCAASAAGAFSGLVLVAPAHILAELTASLDAATRAKLAGTLAKDLVGVPDHELQPHLAEWVPPTDRR